MEMSPQMERLHRARSGLVMASPFFGSLALMLNMKVDPKSKHAFWIDGTTIGVHPGVVDEMPMDELEGMLARATLHAALGHPIRRAGRDAQRWNEAAAHVASLEVLGSGMKLPQGSPADPQYNGMTVEQVYNLLAPPPSDEEGKGEGQGQGQGDAGSGGKGKPSTDPGATPQGAPGEPGDPSQGEAAPTPEEGTGEVRDAEGDAAELEQQAAQWQEAVAQAAQVARAQGNLPGNLERAAQKVVDAKVAWREALQRFFKAKAQDDHSWLKPSRRYLPLGLYLPGLDSVRMGPLVFAVDMSGSVGQEAIDQFFAEVETARVECNPEYILVLPFDSQVRAALKFEGDDTIEIKARAGGGTDFAPAVAWLREHEINPEALVYLTDLECNSFAVEPEYPVLWVSTRPGKAPYGEIINLV